MNRNIFVVLLGFVVVVLIAQLPIFPYVGELREISESGESLSQNWEKVSMPEFYDMAMFANHAWLDSTRYMYYGLFVLNHVILFAVYWIAAKLLRKILVRRPNQFR